MQATPAHQRGGRLLGEEIGKFFGEKFVGLWGRNGYGVSFTTRLEKFAKIVIITYTHKIQA
jgi:hypothetical protein